MDDDNLVAVRMPLFAAAWMASAVAWSVVLVLDSGVAIPPILAALMTQVAVLVAMGAGVRRARSTRAAHHIAMVACVLLGWIVLALFADTAGLRDVLGVMLLTLYSVPAFAFAWGWQIESALVAATLVPAIILLPWLVPSDHQAELVTAVILGTGVSLAVAESTARGLRHSHQYRRAAEARTRELAASRDAYRDLAENVRDFIWAVDLEGRWTYLNRAFERFFGAAPGELIGRFAHEKVLEHPGSAKVDVEIQRILAGEMRPPLRFLFDSAAGPRWGEALPSPVFAPDGTLMGVRGVSRDVTERIVIDTQLRESEAKFRMVAEAMATPVFLVQGTQMRYVNAASEKMLGYTEEEQLAMPFWEILHPDERPVVLERAMARQRGENVPSGLEYRVCTKSGEVRWVEFTAVLIDFEGQPTILGTAIDVTDRKLAEATLRTSVEELRQSEERLRLLARRQVTIREDERRRIGFDLHDGVCQELIGVGILMASVRDRLQPQARESAAALGHAIGYVNDVVEHLRVLARELRPMLLHDLGLEVSLGALVTGLTSAERPVEIRLDTPIPRLPEDVELAVYRIAQEALANAIRHAHARSILLTITAGDRSLRLEVRDDGRGFDPRQRSAKTLGLVGMQERATALSGSLTITSTPGNGTTVTFEWAAPP